MEKLVRKVHCNYEETDELRKIYVRDLTGIPDLAISAVEKNKMFTVGDILDHWKELSEVKGIGAVRIRHIKAAIFAQICEMGLLRKCELVERYE
jgi:DNA integrity scanning protein DisA with diadenylate cyclase activity